MERPLATGGRSTYVVLTLLDAVGVLNTRFIIYNTNFVIFNAKSILLNANSGELTFASSSICARRLASLAFTHPSF